MLVWLHTETESLLQAELTKGQAINHYQKTMYTTIATATPTLTTKPAVNKLIKEFGVNPQILEMTKSLYWSIAPKAGYAKNNWETISEQIKNGLTQKGVKFSDYSTSIRIYF